MASYPIRADWFGWDGGAVAVVAPPKGGAVAAQPIPVTKNVGGRDYMLDSIDAMAGGADWRIQATPIDMYDAALFVDGVYQSDGTGSGWVAHSSKGVTPGPHSVTIGIKTGSGAGLPGNDLANADIVIDFGLVVFPPLAA